jgi:hypothetical protein
LYNPATKPFHLKISGQELGSALLNVMPEDTHKRERLAASSRITSINGL